jgi:hypothetical protein
VSFGHEHGAGVAQALDDRRVVVDDLIDVRLTAERRANPFRGEQILRSPRNSVQGSTILARLDLAIGVRRLLPRQILGQRHVEVERWLITLQAARGTSR